MTGDFIIFMGQHVTACRQNEGANRQLRAKKCYKKHKFGDTGQSILKDVLILLNKSAFYCTILKKMPTTDVVPFAHT